jgi:AdoMet-dependent rRNA methyltransferase SPB1
MPANRVLIGVDLVKIKPIPGVTTFASDITTAHCRNELTKLTNGTLADWYVVTPKTQLPDRLIS